MEEQERQRRQAEAEQRQRIDSGDPECKFVSWNEPVKEKCPTCNSYMVKKYMHYTLRPHLAIYIYLQKLMALFLIFAKSYLTFLSY